MIAADVVAQQPEPLAAVIVVVILAGIATAAGILAIVLEGIAPNLLDRILGPDGLETEEHDR